MKSSYLLLVLSLTAFVAMAARAEDAKETTNQKAKPEPNITVEKDGLLRASDLGIESFEIKAPSGNGMALSIITVVYDPEKGVEPLMTQEHIFFSREKAGYSKKILINDTHFWEQGSSRYVIRGPLGLSRPITGAGGSSIIHGPFDYLLKRLADKNNPIKLTGKEDPKETERMNAYFKRRYRHVVTLTAWTEGKKAEYRYSVFARLRPIAEYNGTDVETAFRPSVQTGFTYSNPFVKLPPEIAEHFKDVKDVAKQKD